MIDTSLFVPVKKGCNHIKKMCITIDPATTDYERDCFLMGYCTKCKTYHLYGYLDELSFVKRMWLKALKLLKKITYIIGA